MEAEEVAGSALSSASSKRGLLTLHQSLEALWDACETEGAPAAEELVAVGISAPELFAAAVRRVAAVLGGVLDHPHAGFSIVPLEPGAEPAVGLLAFAAGGDEVGRVLPLSPLVGCFQAAGFDLAADGCALHFRRDDPTAVPAATAARRYLLQLDFPAAAGELQQLRLAFDVFDGSRNGWLVGWPPAETAAESAVEEAAEANADCGHALRAILRAVGVPAGGNAALRRRLAAVPLHPPAGGDDAAASTARGSTERVYFAQLACMIAEYLTKGSGPVSHVEVVERPSPVVPLAALPPLQAVYLHQPAGVGGAAARWRLTAAELVLSAQRLRLTEGGVGSHGVGSHGRSVPLQLTVAAEWALPPPPSPELDGQPRAPPPAGADQGLALVTVPAAAVSTSRTAAAGLVVLGGYRQAGGKAARLRTAFALAIGPDRQGAHGTWQPLPEMLSCRSGGLAVWTGGGVLAIGGHGGGGAAGDFSQRGYVLRAAEYLAGPAGQGVGSQGLLSEAAEWEPWPAMREGRANFGGCLLLPAADKPNQKRLVVGGGCGADGQPLASVEMFDIKSRRWRPLPPLTEAREGAALLAVGKQALLAVGGTVAAPGGERRPASSIEVLLLPPGAKLSHLPGWRRLERQLQVGRPLCAVGCHPVVLGGESGHPATVVVATGGTGRAAQAGVGAAGEVAAEYCVIDEDGFDELESADSKQSKGPKWYPAAIGPGLADFGAQAGLAVLMAMT